MMFSNKLITQNRRLPLAWRTTAAVSDGRLRFLRRLKIAIGKSSQTTHSTLKVAYTFKERPTVAVASTIDLSVEFGGDVNLRLKRRKSIIF